MMFINLVDNVARLTVVTVPVVVSVVQNIPRIALLRTARTYTWKRGSISSRYGIKSLEHKLNTVLIGYYDYLGTRPKNSHRPIIVTGR